MIKISPDLSRSIYALVWSPSSSRLLAAAIDQIQVFSLEKPSNRATIRNPVPGTGKLPLVQFGARDSEVVICSPFGQKFVAFDLSTSKAVEVNNPKFTQPSSASRGFSVRPQTAHLALLTRVGGKDMVSLHHPDTREVQRSWYPETVDAQGLSWTPDGRWLLLWESPAHGHKLLLYTPDGQLFRSIGAFSVAERPDADLEPGYKLCRVSPDAALCAVGDHSRSVGVLGTQTWRGGLRLLHPTTIVPKDTLQVRYLLSPLRSIEASNNSQGLARTGHQLGWRTIHTHVSSSNPDDFPSWSIGGWEAFRRIEPWMLLGCI